MIGLIHSQAELLGYNKMCVWVRIPWLNDSYRILTMPRDWLPRGMSTADALEVEYTLESIRAYTEDELWGGYTGDVKILSAIWRQSDQGSSADGLVQGTA